MENNNGLGNNGSTNLPDNNLAGNSPAQKVGQTVGEVRPVDGETRKIRMDVLIMLIVLGVLVILLVGTIVVFYTGGEEGELALIENNVEDEQEVDQENEVTEGISNREDRLDRVNLGLIRVLKCMDDNSENVDFRVLCGELLNEIDEAELEEVYNTQYDYYNTIYSEKVIFDLDRFGVEDDELFLVEVGGMLDEYAEVYDVDGVEYQIAEVV